MDGGTGTGPCSTADAAAALQDLYDLALQVIEGIDGRLLRRRPDGRVVGVDAPPPRGDQLGDAPHDLVPDLVQLLPSLLSAALHPDGTKRPANAHGQRGAPATPQGRKDIGAAVDANG